MTVRSSSFDLKLVVEETLALAEPLVTNPTVPHTLDASQRLTSATTPDVTQVWSGTVALVAGAKTLDLTALAAGPYGTTIDLTGKKIRQVIASCPSTNAGAVKFAKGGSNAIMLGGHVDDVFSVPAGCTDGKYLASGGPTVGSGAKNVALTGTGTDTVNLVIVCGTA